MGRKTLLMALLFVTALAVSACSKEDETAAKKAEPTQAAEAPAPIIATTTPEDHAAAIEAAAKATREARAQIDDARRRTAELEESIRHEQAKAALLAEQNRLLSEQNARLSAQQLDEQQRSLIAQQQALIDAQSRAAAAQAEAAAAQTEAAQTIVDNYRRDRRQVLPSPPRRPPGTPGNHAPNSVSQFTALPPPVTAMPPPVTAFPSPESAIPRDR